MFITHKTEVANTDLMPDLNKNYYFPSWKDKDIFSLNARLFPLGPYYKICPFQNIYS